MPFFIRGGKQRRGRGQRKVNAPPKKPPKPKEDAEVTSSEDEEGDEDIREARRYRETEDSGEEDEEETPQAKKARLAEQYLAELKQQLRDEGDDEATEEQIASDVGRILQDEVLEAAGKLQRSVADTYVDSYSSQTVLRSKYHKLSVTCVVITQDEQFIFSASKDPTIVKWNIAGEKLGHIDGLHKMADKTRPCHRSHIYALAVSSDGKFLVSGDAAGHIHVWDAALLTHLHKFRKHRKAVTGLAFRRETHTLYSCSFDRLVMTWDLDTMAFVENLGGHQDGVTSVDALHRESCISSGGRDETVVVYVICDDKQLQFTGRQVSIDGVKLLNEKTFVTYGQDGSVAVWSTVRKRPQHVLKAAHGMQEGVLEANWITSIATLVNTDLLATGSMDGCIRLWHVDSSKGYRISQVTSIPVTGVVNSLAFTPSGSALIAGVGREHKLGRWFNNKAAKNSVVLIPFDRSKYKKG